MEGSYDSSLTFGASLKLQRLRWLPTVLTESTPEKG